MPVYSYHCKCGAEFDKVLPLAQYLTPQYHVGPCAYADVPASKVVTAPTVLNDFAGYDCPVTGRRIEGRKAHRENLARTDCRIFEPGERESFVRTKAKEEASLDAQVDHTVDGFIANLPSDKRDRLAAELEGGLDVNLTRSTAQGV